MCGACILLTIEDLACAAQVRPGLGALIAEHIQDSVPARSHIACACTVPHAERSVKEKISVITREI